jgi:hypothetical protein
MSRPKGRRYVFLIVEHSILADFGAEWGLCFSHAILSGRKIPFSVLLLTSSIFINIVA